MQCGKGKDSTAVQNYLWIKRSLIFIKKFFNALSYFLWNISCIKSCYVFSYTSFCKETRIKTLLQMRLHKVCHFWQEHGFMSRLIYGALPSLLPLRSHSAKSASVWEQERCSPLSKSQATQCSVLVLAKEMTTFTEISSGSQAFLSPSVDTHVTYSRESHAVSWNIIAKCGTRELMRHSSRNNIRNI